MKRYGLLGAHLSHSLSPQIHSFFGEYPYDLVEKEQSELAAWFANMPYEAINVTIPYKKTVLAFCTELDEVATRIGSVNTIRFDGQTVRGYNTDYFGFSYMLRHGGIDVCGKKVLVLGNGGACATVCCVLRDLEAAEVVVISRSGENNYGNLDRHADADIIINTTPVGMYPDTNGTPLSLELFTHCTAVADLIYNPLRTRLLQDADKRGMKTVNGLSMLVAQGYRAAEIFLDKQLDPTLIAQALQTLERQFRNIVLVGMPGCGKSTVGRLLADQLGRRFLDTDTAVQQTVGMPIADLFAVQCEAAFRALETQTVQQLGKQSGAIIATGGGAVINPENRKALRQNAVVVFLDRDLHTLATDGRPLSRDREALQTMYEQRLPLYHDAADVTVKVSGTPDDVCRRIREVIGE